MEESYAAHSYLTISSHRETGKGYFPRRLHCDTRMKKKQMHNFVKGSGKRKIEKNGKEERNFLWISILHLATTAEVASNIY